MPRIEILPSQAGDRLDKFLTEIMEASRSHIQRLIRQDAITINNKPAKSGKILEQGDIVYYPEIERSIPVKEGATPVLDVVYEDDDLLVINKPAGLLVHEALKDERRVTVVD